MRIATTTLLLILFTLAYGQNNAYIVMENALWSTVELHCLPNGNLYSTHHIKFEGDTLFENNVYKKVYRCNDESQLDWFYNGMIREDEQNKVFFKPPGYPAGMIYDFGVSLNDTIKAVNPYLNAFDTLNFVVTAIDSVELLDGFHKRISLYEYNNNKEEVWIEGLGSYYGVLNSCNNAYGAICGGYEALCFETNGILVYQHNLYETCYYAALVPVDEIDWRDLKIYPNPATSLLYIEISSSIAMGYDPIAELYSIDGKKIAEKKLAKNKNALYLPQVNKGLYILKIKQRGSYSVLPSFKILFD